MLEVGCGSGGNLWVISEQGFKTIGIDLSVKGIELANQMLQYRNLRAKLLTQDMCNISAVIEQSSIDIVVDVFSSNCLSEKQFDTYLEELKKILKQDGIFFLYTPSKRSDAYTNHKPSIMIDSSTLNSISRKNSPYRGNNYPFRFEHENDLQEKLKNNGLRIKYLEKTSRTYNNTNETFEFLVVEAIKN